MKKHLPATNSIFVLASGKIHFKQTHVPYFLYWRVVSSRVILGKARRK